MADWGKIHLLEGRLAWHKATDYAYRRKKLLDYKHEGDVSHLWHDRHVRNHEWAAAKKNEEQWPRIRAEIAKWKKLLDESEHEIHALETAIRALKPKTQAWALGGLVAPGESWWDQRWDEGKDLELVRYRAYRAPGNGHVVQYGHDGPFPYGFGSPYLVLWLDSGPFHDAAVRRGREPTWYGGHAEEVLVRPGEHFSVGQPLARLNNSLNWGRGWLEFGKWPPGPMNEGISWADCYRTVYR